MINLFKVYTNTKDALSRIERVLESGYTGEGPVTAEFEALLRSHFDNDYVLTMNSCTSALTLAIHIIKEKYNLNSSNEVLCTPLTCSAASLSAVNNNLKIKWVDVDIKTLNMDLEDLKSKLTPSTRIVLLVHWGGTPIDLTGLEEIKKYYKEKFNNDLLVVEDCAHIWDGYYKNILVGNSGNYCCFSLQSIKFLSTGDGGILITPDAESYETARLKRWFGLDRNKGQSFRCVQDIKSRGFKYQLTDIASAIGIANMPGALQNVAKNKRIARIYNAELKIIPRITLLERQRGVESSYWLYSLLVEDRPNFINAMKSRGVEVSPVHSRNDKYSCFEEFRADLPGMDYLEDKYISIPIGYWLSDEDIQHIINSIKGGW